MYGTLLWLANGTIAIDTGVSRPPNSAATFSRCTSSRAATTPLAGLLSSSRTTSSTFLPSTPPLALISSMATDRPRTMASPDLADWPDMAATRPNLTVSSASAGAERTRAAPTKSARRDRHFAVTDMGAPPLIRSADSQAPCQWRDSRNRRYFNGLRNRAAPLLD